MSGESVSFTERDLDEVVQSYDPTRHEAPIVVGHPRTDSPAYGWVRTLARNGAALEATVDQLDPAFAELVEAGRFKKVSASFYRPESPSNPTPGKWHLRHVGFLGAQPPAVKGLRAVSFAGSDQGVLTVEFAQGDLAELVKRLRAWIEEQVGAEAAAQATALAELEAAVAAGAEATEVSEEVADAIVEEATTAAVDAVVETLDVPAEKKEELQQAVAEAVQAAVDTAASSSDSVSHSERRRRRRGSFTPRSPRERALDQREADLERRERELRRTEYLNYLEGLVREGRPLPCSRETMLAFFEVLEHVDRGAVAFGEHERRHPVEIFKAEILERLPKQVDFSERAPAGEGGDDDDLAATLARRASEYQAEQAAHGRVVTTAEAVRHVSKGAK